MQVPVRATSRKSGQVLEGEKEEDLPPAPVIPFPGASKATAFMDINIMLEQHLPQILGEQTPYRLHHFGLSLDM